MRRMFLTAVLAVLIIGLGSGAALACGGLVGRNGAVNLVRTTTLAAYHDGVEHYVTAFKFAGAGGEFGSIVPLPGIPSDVQRGGDWTLQRLVREVRPPAAERLALAAADGDTTASAKVILEKRIDALDITVLEGGGDSVGKWAAEHGFLLSPDAPEVLDFYARRSPVFLAARFDADAARQRGVALGDGTPVHITIPTPNPWVPLRILGLGLKPAERVNADVFLMTGERPALLPGADAPGLRLKSQVRASSGLLDDLRSDKGMEWMPEKMWLSFLEVNASPNQLTYDLAVDASGTGIPSYTAAGLDGPSDPVLDGGLGLVSQPESDAGGSLSGPALAAVIGSGGAVVLFALALVSRRVGRP